MSRETTPPGLHPDISHILFSTEEIAERVGALGGAITGDYRDLDPILLAVLKGVTPFLTDLARRLPFSCSIDFLAVEPFVAGRHGSSVQVIKDLEEPVTGRHVLIIEDIIDTGLTLNYLLRWLSQQRPASLQVCTLLDRPRRRLVDLPLRYLGFEAPDDYLVGYGLDFQERYRHLPYLGILRPDIYTNR